MTNRIPILLAAAYAALSTFAMMVALLGKDSLSGIFVAILGAPWVQLIDRLLDAVAPRAFGGRAVGIVAGVLGMTLNAVLIYLIAKWIMRFWAAPRSN